MKNHKLEPMTNNIQTTTFPKLYSKDSLGNIRVWEVTADGDNIIVKHGVLNGKMQVNVTTATLKRYTPTQEAEALWKKKKRLKYRETIEEASEALILPMLAKTYRGHHGIFYIQPKLDGVRCLAIKKGNQITLKSRGNKPINLPHIVEALNHIMDDGDIFDGELYIHGKPFEFITSIVRRENHPEEHQCEYHIFDVPSLNYKPVYQELRMSKLDALKIRNTSGCLKIVDTIRASITHPSQVAQYLETFILEGYEGIMLRRSGYLYEYGKRSSSLFKHKSFQDAEFKVVDITQGRGRFEGLPVFTCTTNPKQGPLFDCVIKGTEEFRADIFQNKEKYLGKMLTVRYQDFSMYGVPRFPVGIRFRDDNL